LKLAPALQAYAVPREFSALKKSGSIEACAILTVFGLLKIIFRFEKKRLH